MRPQHHKRPTTGGNATAVVLGLGCVALFCLPALFVTRGYTVAGDRQKEGREAIEKITADDAQRRRS